MNTKKTILFIFILFCFGSSFARLNNSVSLETIAEVLKLNIADSIPKIKPLYILDEKKIEAAAFRKINPKSIFKVNVLKHDAAVKKYGRQAKDGAIVVLTKKFAISSYQERLSLLSKDYKQYLKEHHNDDKLLFIINGVEYQSSSWERTEKLYSIFSSDVVSHDNLKLSFTTGTATIQTSVIINTKII